MKLSYVKAIQLCTGDDRHSCELVNTSIYSRLSSYQLYGHLLNYGHVESVEKKEQKLRIILLP